MRRFAGSCYAGRGHDEIHKVTVGKVECGRREGKGRNRCREAPFTTTVLLISDGRSYFDLCVVQYRITRGSAAIEEFIDDLIEKQR
jgi:hypothetical protein